MSTWDVAAARSDDRLTVTCSEQGTGRVVRFEAWVSHLQPLTATQRRAYLVARLAEAIAAPAAPPALPSTLTVP